MINLVRRFISREDYDAEKVEYEYLGGVFYRKDGLLFLCYDQSIYAVELGPDKDFMLYCDVIMCIHYDDRTLIIKAAYGGGYKVVTKIAYGKITPTDHYYVNAGCLSKSDIIHGRDEYIIRFRNADTGRIEFYDGKLESLNGCAAINDETVVHGNILLYSLNGGRLSDINIAYVRDKVEGRLFINNKLVDSSIVVDKILLHLHERPVIDVLRGDRHNGFLDSGEWYFIVVADPYIKRKIVYGRCVNNLNTGIIIRNMIKEMNKKDDLQQHI